MIMRLFKRGGHHLKRLVNQIAQIGRDDPRRLIHSIKVSLAVTIVSLLYYFRLLYDSFGVSAMWAVVTVVVIFEFYVGATLGKGLNRVLATLVAGGLGLGAHYLASLTGRTSEPILTGLFVFLFAMASTYLRFFPKIKDRYDYGMMVFILTFCMVSISGLQTEGVLKLAQMRLLTIFLGALACMVVSIFICPVWAGEDLHKLVARNLHELGSFLEGFSEESLKSEGAKDGEPSMVQLNNIIVNSKKNEETLVNLARWEPSHGRFMYHHPWKQYLKIGSLTRQCACCIKSLNSYLTMKTQTLKEIHEAFLAMTMELGKALKEQAWNVERMTKPSLRNLGMEHVKTEAKKVKAFLKRGLWQEEEEIRNVIVQVATSASLLMDIAGCVEAISEEVYGLSLLAKFEGEEDSSKGFEGDRIMDDVCSPGNGVGTRIDDGIAETV